MALSVERRIFLSAASVGSLLTGPLAWLANAQRDSSFKTARSKLPGTRSFIAAMDKARRFS